MSTTDKLLRQPLTSYIVGWGSGTANVSCIPTTCLSGNAESSLFQFPYLIDPYSAILHYATREDYHTSVEAVLNDTNYDQQQMVARRSDVCLVFVSADSGEAYITNVML